MVTVRAINEVTIALDQRFLHSRTDNFITNPHHDAVSEPSLRLGRRPLTEQRPRPFDLLSRLTALRTRIEMGGERLRRIS